MSKAGLLAFEEGLYQEFLLFETLLSKRISYSLILKPVELFTIVAKEYIKFDMMIKNRLLQDALVLLKLVNDFALD